MFSFKKKYYFIIESIKDIDLKKLKKRKKFTIIYRNQNNSENITDILLFRKKCKTKSVKFYVDNNLNLALKLNSDGVYLSSHNKALSALHIKKLNFQIMGSAHSHKEVCMKIKQGCGVIILSKLFSVSYNKKAPFYGVIKFNNLLRSYKNLVPLGGINLSNLNNLSNVDCLGFALMTEIKKKPAKIIDRLF